MKTIAIAIAACAALAVPAVAQAQVYGNLSYTNVDVEDENVNLALIQGRVGYDVNPNFAIEAEAGFGITDDDFAGVNIEMKHQLGVYMVGKAKVSENIEFLARAGYVTYEVEASVGAVSATDSGSDFAFGVGAQAFVTENDGIRFDWTNYGGDANTWSVGYVRKF